MGCEMLFVTKWFFSKRSFCSINHNHEGIIYTVIPWTRCMQMNLQHWHLKSWSALPLFSIYRYSFFIHYSVVFTVKPSEQVREDHSVLRSYSVGSDGTFWTPVCLSFLNLMIFMSPFQQLWSRPSLNRLQIVASLSGSHSCLSCFSCCCSR